MKKYLLILVLLLRSLASFSQSNICSNGNDTIVKIDTIQSIEQQLNCMCDTFIYDTVVIIQQSCCCIYTKKVELTYTQIQNATSFPVNIGIPTSSIGYYYRVTAFDCKQQFGTTAFNSSILNISTTSEISLGGQPQYCNMVILKPTNNFQSGFPYSGSPGQSIKDNDTLSIYTDTDSIGVGDSSETCWVGYQIIKE